MRVFVTGATGVLGRPVLKQFVKSGASVLALSRSDENRRLISRLGATAVDANLFDPVSLAPHLAECDAVLHLATSIPKTSDMKRSGAWSQNDRIREAGTAALVEATKAAGTAKTFIYPSVSFMYGDGGDGWLTAETARIEPAGPLLSTLAAERSVAGFAKSADGRRGVSLRFGVFYGPASRESQDTLRMARRGMALPLSPAKAFKSHIWVEDAASAVIAALQRAPNGVYDVVEDEPFTQEQATSALARAVGRRSLVKLPRVLLRLALPFEMRALLARSQRVSAARFKDVTGWKPQVPNQTDGWMRIAASVEFPATA